MSGGILGVNLLVAEGAQDRCYIAPGQAWERWPVQGYDPQRTACWDCPEDLVSGVDYPESQGITRVNLAMDSANPASGQAQFSLSLPERAEVPAGTHLVSWDGRDDEGRTASSGQFLLRLTAKGSRIDEHMVRKVTWVR